MPETVKMFSSYFCRGQGNQKKEMSTDREFGFSKDLSALFPSYLKLNPHVVVVTSLALAWLCFLSICPLATKSLSLERVQKQS